MVVEAGIELSPKIFEAFGEWINQRPGLDPRNYYNPDLIRTNYADGRRAYRTESRKITKQGTQARRALAQAMQMEWNAEAMAKAFSAYSGRLEPRVDEKSASGFGFNYSTGQYWPTEYRAAARAVLEAYIEAVRPKRLPTPGDRFTTVAAMAEANHAAGGHWFDRGTKKFFGSRIFDDVYQGNRNVFFVSSEKDFRGKRLYTVRAFDVTTAQVATPGEFNEYPTHIAARAQARRLADMDRSNHTKPLGNDKCSICGHYGEACNAQS